MVMVQNCEVKVSEHSSNVNSVPVESMNKEDYSWEHFKGSKLCKLFPKLILFQRI
jgi:hypothetical protein